MSRLRCCAPTRSTSWPGRARGSTRYAATCVRARGRRQRPHPTMQRPAQVGGRAASGALGPVEEPRGPNRASATPARLDSRTTPRSGGPIASKKGCATSLPSRARRARRPSTPGRPGPGDPAQTVLYSPPHPPDPPVHRCHPRARIVQRAHRIDERQDPRHYPRRLRLPLGRRTHRLGHALLRRLQAGLTRPKMTHRSVRRSGYGMGSYGNRTSAN